MATDNSMQTVYEIMDMQKTIYEIDIILQSNPLDAEMARRKVVEINAFHPENIGIYGLFFSSGQSVVTVASATDAQLRDDLLWKRYYLNAKCAGKKRIKCEKSYFKNEEIMMDKMNLDSST